MSGTSRNRGAEIGILVLPALPAALSVYFAFNSGGLFELTTAFGAVLVLAVAVIALATSSRPLAALAPRGLLAAGLLALFGAWTLRAGGWSDAGARALASFDRVLLYLAILALFACVPRTEKRFRWLLRWLLAGTALVAAAGLTSRLLPTVWPTSAGLVSDRLSYPVTYWNSFGLLVGMACILAFHHASDEREPAAARVAAAALLPLLSTALFLTFSRGAIAVTLLAVLVYAVAARPRGLPAALLAAGPAVTIALAVTNSAELVHGGTPLTPAALSQAHELAWILAGCVLLAGAVRALALPLDRRLAAIVLSATAVRRAWTLSLGIALIAVMAFLAAGGTSSVHRQYDEFVDKAPAGAGAEGSQSARLLDLGNDGRLPLWEVAQDSFSEQPLTGAGAGTYELEWQRQRGVGQGHERRYAYSLYFETLGELGLIGTLLLLGVLLVLLVGTAVLIRGPDRAIHAAGFALLVAWILHAGLDIGWQTPAAGVLVFALCGFALARRDESAALTDNRPQWLQAVARLAGGGLRPVLALACLALAVLPARQAIGYAEAQDSIAALDARDCGSARDHAKDAIATANTGPRPYEVLAICAAREDRPGIAVRRAGQAVSHDPESWEPHFVLALTRGSSGLDPRAEARAALTANPSRGLLRTAVKEFDSAGPKRWRKLARTLPFALE